jgi:TetR/AcrR family transcriptional regulator, transcriptional repressor for nem operon
MGIDLTALRETVLSYALQNWFPYAGPVGSQRQGDGRWHGPDDSECFFTGLGGFFGAGRQARQGCLMINSITEHEGRSTRLGRRAQAFRDRLNAAFANAMAGQHEPGLVRERAQLLTATTLGIWLTARIDPGGAAHACDATAACIRT